MNLEVRIPESLDDIKLKDYIKMVNLLSNVEDEHELIIKIRLAALSTGLPLEDIVKIPAMELNKIVDQVMAVLNEKPKLKPIIKVDGKEFGFIPDLENLMTNEYLDLSLFFGTDILKTTAVLYRPVKNKVKNLYTIEDYKGIKDIEIYDNFPASAYISCVLFFYSLANDCLKTIPAFLEANLTADQRVNLEASGAGISHLTKLVETIDLSIMT